MEALASSEVFLFDDFRLDRRGGGLFRRDDSGVFVPVTIGSRGLDILGVLVARAGEVVSKEEIISAVWPSTVVEDSNLTVQISALRRALDRGRAKGSCIQTVPGRGYRFVGAAAQPVAEVPSALSPLDDAPLAVVLSPIEAGVRGQLSRPLLGIGSTRRLPAILAPAIAAVVGVVLVLAGGAWWLWSTTRPALVAVSIQQPFVRATFVDRRPALRQSQQRPRSAIFC